MTPKLNPQLDASKKAELNKMLAGKIRDYAEENFGVSLKMAGGRLAHSPEHSSIIGRSFTGVYIRDIAASTYGLREDRDIDIEAGLRCDGGNDLGIDFGCWSDGWLYIIQSKYIGDGGNLDRKDMLDFVGIDERIRSDALTGANLEVRDLLEEDFDSATNVRYILVTNGSVSSEVSKVFNKKFNQIRSESGRGLIEPWLFDWKKLQKSYEEERTPMARGVGLTVRIPVRAIGGNAPCVNLSSAFTGASGQPQGTVLLVARGDDIRKLFAKHRDNLFHANIRGYLGSGRRTNKGMEHTLKNAPELFYLYNNGMSALCNGMKFPEGAGNRELECRGFQIINGAQTASTIGEFSQTDALEKVNVLLRVTNVGVAGDAGSKLSHAIISANNSQNVIKVADFHSNDPVQEFLQREFAKVRYPGAVPAAIWYVPKRGIPRPKFVPKIPKPRELKMEILAKALYAYSHKWNRPSKIYSQSTFLFITKDEDKEGVYLDLFGDAQGNKVSSMGKDDLRRVIAIAFLRLYLDKRLRDGRKEYDEVRDSSVEYMCYCAGWHFLWAFGCALRRFHPGREKEVYKRIVDGDGLADGGFVEQWFDSIEDAILDALEAENDPDSGEVLNFKIWLRNKDKVIALKRRIERLRNPQKKFPLP